MQDGIMSVMIYLITALDAEARPLIEHYRLKRDYTLPYTLYRNDETVLLVTQPGKINALMALSTLLGYLIPSDNDILINIGICAAPERIALAEALLVHQIIENDRRHYPDILYPHSLRESTLQCFDTPQDIPSEHPADMESAGIFRVAAKFFQLHRIALLKIVSDHFDPDSVTKEGAIALIRSHLQTLDSLIGSIQSISDKKPLFDAEQEKYVAQLKTHFTVAQGVRLEEALRYFHLKNPQRPFPLFNDFVPSSKRERSELLEAYITTLTA